MSLTKMMPDKELIRKVTEILFKELGYTDAIRFLSKIRACSIQIIASTVCSNLSA
jgi:hypothetical protein